jgi:aminopeptidase YwaD
MSKDSIDNTDVSEALRLTKKIIEDYGPRLPGSESSEKAANFLYQEIQKNSDSAKKELFIFAPNAFFGFFQIFVVSYIVASILVFFEGNMIYISAVIAIIGTICAVSQFVYYWGLFDVFYKKKTGSNIVGTIEPDNLSDVQQEIIVCGHLDSAWIVNFIVKAQKIYAIRLIISIGYVLVVFALIWLWTIYYTITGNIPFFDNFLKYGSLVGFPIVIQLLWYIDWKKGSPGAGDNLISCTMAIVIGKILNNAKKSGNNLLKNTRVKIICFDAEEAATKGSQAYAKVHKQEFAALPTYALCPDCIYNMKDFAILKSDQNGYTKNDMGIINDCVEIGKKFGYENIPVNPWPFGGGASDAAPLSRAGAKAMSFMGMSTKIIRDDLVQHTSNDTVNAVEPKIVEAIMKIMLEYILQQDKKLNK